MVQFNPFIVEGYKSPEYFCDRALDTQMLMEHLKNQRNVALISQRRLGKSGLIHNLFYQDEIKKEFYTFYVDIYDTKNLTELTYELGKCVLAELRSKGRQVWERFVAVLKSLKMGVSFDINGNPEWGVTIGEIHTPDILLDEIFKYLESADKPCIVALDEFQIVADYPEKTVEATLRKRIQNCHNVHFIYSGSKRHMMSEIFLSQSRPFYNSTTLMGLEPIDKILYFNFANHHLQSGRQAISEEAFFYLYEWAEGVTWYIQSVLNVLYALKQTDVVFEVEDVDKAISTIVQNHTFAYKALLYQLSVKQKQVLQAIALEGKASQIMSQRYLRKYSLTASTIQAAVKVLLDRDFITFDENIYQVSDRFFELYLRLQQ